MTHPSRSSRIGILSHVDSDVFCRNETPLFLNGTELTAIVNNADVYNIPKRASKVNEKLIVSGISFAYLSFSLIRSFFYESKSFHFYFFTYSCNYIG
jgi:hypothetical protein